MFRRALALILLMLPVTATANPAPPTALLGGESVAVTDDARAMLGNPAGIGVRYPSELWLSWAGTPDRERFESGILTLGRVGYAMTPEPAGVRRHAFGLSLGGDRFRLGWANDLWIAGRPREQRTLDARAGLLMRPAPWLSLGTNVAHVFEPSFAGARRPRTYTVGLGLRPLALSRTRAHTSGVRFTLTGDVTLEERADNGSARVRVGAAVEPLRGLEMAVTAGDHGAVTVGFTLRSVRSHAGVARTGSDRDPDVSRYTFSSHRGEDRALKVAKAEQRVALVRVGGPLADEDLGGGLMGGGGARPSGPIHDQLERALHDPLTRGVFLELSGSAGMAQLEELRPRLQRLTLAGKPVVAWLANGGSRGDLYMASAATRVYTSPAASFDGLGLRTERRYYRRMLERAGIRMDRSSIGDFKSAYRNYSVDSTPPADTTVIQRMLEQRQTLFVNALENGRKVPAERFLPVLDGRSYDGRAMIKAGLVDSVGWREDAVAELGRLTGLGRRPELVDLSRHPESRERWLTPARIAVIYAGGGIVDGRSGRDVIDGSSLGDRTFAAQLEAALRTPGVKAVVIRVDSPGGSSSASHHMDHVVQRLRAEFKKPIIVSMASVAASGGYFMSAHADRILANRHTVTGSIGVLFVKPSFEGLYEKLGVRQDDFDRGDFMRGVSPARDWRPQDQAAADAAIKRTYQTFVNQVADGRRLQGFEVYARAQGRPWMGDDAVEHKLVDAIGGLESALVEARRLAGIPQEERIALVRFGHPAGSWLERLAGTWVRERFAELARLDRVRGLQSRAEDWVEDLD
jgi:protease IV